MIEINNKTKSKIDTKLVRDVAQKFLKKYKQLDKEISIAFVGDKEIQKLNKIYRNKDKITDVLSFEGEDEFLGEIVIDYAQIKRQSKKFSKNEKEEMVFILVHGLLHLVGYDDKAEKDAKKMEKLGKEFIVQNIK